jgi:adenylate cyclase class IV
LEVETKYALSEIDFKRISIIFAKRLAENLFKKDSYYSRYSTRKKAIAKGEPVIRIREENGKSYLTLKHKNFKKSYEYNEEEETLVDDIKVVKNLLFASGYEEFFYKEKNSWSFFREVPIKKDNKEEKKILVHMELEEVNGRYHYLELEVTDKDASLEDSIYAIQEVAKSVQVTDDMRDDRTWPEILGVKV